MGVFQRFQSVTSAGRRALRDRPYGSEGRVKSRASLAS